MELKFNPIVAEDLKAIKEFIAKDNEEMAIRVIDNIFKQMELIQVFPNLGAKLAERVNFRSDYRYVVWGDYIILYKTEEDTVYIYRVLNRYQDITRIFD